MEDNRYSKMQREFYDNEAKEWSIDNRNPVVGSFDEHNNWEDYNFLFEGLDTQTTFALDFGCGPGRNIAKYWDKFNKIEGVDISLEVLKKAKDYLASKEIETHLFICNGYNLDQIASDEYDLVFSTICLQHICVWEIRYSLFKEFFRVLWPGGTFAAQMGFGSNSPQAVPYYYNFYNAENTNRGMDTMVEDPEYLQFDLERIGFKNFEYKVGSTGPGDIHPSWIYFKATKP